MSTINDFKNAPVGATATHKATGDRAMKMNNDEWCWIVKNGFYKGNEGMGDYTLDRPAPESAREALDLAWELAHPVKPGQVIPAGARYLEDQGSGLNESRARYDIDISPGTAPHIRTLDPLPEPLPEWLDAPAVLARVDDSDLQLTEVYTPTGLNNRWIRVGTSWTFHWSELRNVIPLYPKEGQNA